MCKKLMFLISLVLLLGLVSNASAGDVTWTNEYPWSMLWLSAANWDPVGVPGSGDTAIISPQYVDPLAPAIYPGQAPVIDANLVVGEIKGPRHDSDDDQIMLVLAGDVVVNNNWQVGESGTGTATLEISGGNVRTGDLRGMRDGVGILNVKGDAEVSINRFKNFAERDVVTATVNVSENATLTSRSNCDDSFRGEAEYYINVSDDASFEVTNEFKPGDDDSVGVLHVTDDAYMYVQSEWEMCNPDDGSDPYITVTFDSNALVEAGERMRINGSGELLITDNAIVDIDRYMKFADEEDYCYVTMTVNGNAEVSVNGEDDDRGFWFGDEGTGELNIGGNASMYVEERVVIPRCESLLNGSFTMTGGEFTTDNELLVPGEGSCDFTITGGLVTCEEFVVGESLGTLAAMDGGTVDCEDFEYTTNYLMDFTHGELLMDGNDQSLYDDLWAEIMAGRISGFGGCGGRGDISIDQFSIPGRTRVYGNHNPYRAWNPDPACDAVDQPPVVTLSWNAGDDADVHHIFLSTNFDCANEGSLVCWLDSQPDPDTDIVTPELTLGQTYYWRVQEVDTDPPGRETDGQAWQFTVQESFVVDGFEEYSENPNPVYDTWLDGCGTSSGDGGNRTGSCVYTTTAEVHGGGQAMLYYYENSGMDVHFGERDANYSEAKMEYDVPQDWTLYGAEAIELWFFGDPDNDATWLEAMYMVLTDTGSGEGVVVYGDKEPEALEDMQVAEWQQWDVDLAEFGTDLEDVNSIAIGFGDRTNINREPGGYGVMLIDDLGLFPERCVPRYVVDIHDLNDDCETDMKDVKIQADDYLHDDR